MHRESDSQGLEGGTCRVGARGRRVVISGLCIGVPVMLGRCGVGNMYKPKLSERDRDWFNRGIDAHREEISFLVL